MAKAGLRHKELRTSKASRTAVRKKRKAVKNDDTTSEAAPFVYFDESGTGEPAPDTDTEVAAEEPSTPAKKKRRKRKRDEESAPTLAMDDEPTESEIEVSKTAADLWEQIRSDEGDVTPTMSLAAPEPDDDPWATPEDHEPEPERGMPATFAAPRSVESPNHLDPVEYEAVHPTPTPQAPPPPMPGPGSLAPPPPAPATTPEPTPEPAMSDATTPEPTAWPSDPTPDPIAGFEEEPPPPPVAWKAAPTDEIDFGFESVTAVDGLGRRLETEPAPAPAEPAPEPTREIPASFAERPTHQPPAGLRPPIVTEPTKTGSEEPAAALRAKPAGSTVPTNVPDALRPATARDEPDVPEALRSS